MINLPDRLTPLPRGHQVFTWESQVIQYPRRGVPGITLFQSQTGLGPVECLLWRDDKRGHLHGILNYYPVDQGKYERAGNVNLFIDPAWRRRGLATALLDEALHRWPDLNLVQQKYSSMGEAFIRAYVARRGEE